MLRFYYQRYEQLWIDLLIPLSQDLAPIINTLKDQQIATIFAKLNQDNDELRGKYIDQPYAELVQQQIDRMRQRIEKWTDTLNTAQFATVSQWARTLKHLAPHWLA